LKASDKNQNMAEPSLGEIEDAQANKFKHFLLEISVKFKIYTGSP
jgi:hypothetical protein